MVLTDITRMETLRPPVDGGHYSDNPALFLRANNWLKGTSQWFLNQIGYDLALAQDTLLLSGKGSRVLRVPRPPIVQVVSITVGNSPWKVIESGDTDTNQDVMVSDSRCHLISRFCTFPRGFGNVQATLICGYGTVDNSTIPATLTTVIPDDIQNAVALFATIGCLEASYAGFGGETIGPEHIASLARKKADYDSIMDVVRYYSQKVWF